MAGASGLGLFAWNDVPQAQATTGSFLGIPYDASSPVHIVASIAFSAVTASTARRKDGLPAG